MAQFVTAQQVIDNSFSSTNTDPNFIKTTSIEQTQLKHIKPVLTEELYDLIVTENNASSLSAVNQTIFDKNKLLLVVVNYMLKFVFMIYKLNTLILKSLKLIQLLHIKKQSLINLVKYVFLNLQINIIDYSLKPNLLEMSLLMLLKKEMLLLKMILKLEVKNSLINLDGIKIKLQKFGVSDLIIQDLTC